MSDNISNIRDLLEVRPHPTVVRLADLESEAAQWVSDSFLITPEIRTHLSALRQLLERDQGGGAFLIGHYGSGKSHLLGYLVQQLRAGDLVKQKVRVVPLSLVNYSADNRLEDVVSSALGLEAGQGDRRLPWEKLETPLLLVLDELSEFLRSKGDPHAFNEDVRFLQFMGEWARDRRFWILAAMQEGIEHTGELEHSLYRKIKDRYPLRLLLTPAHVQSLIADAILIKRPGYLEAVEELCRRLREMYPSLERELPLLQQIYPLHPATLALLEEIRDRFSETRGVVEFVVTTLRGDDARGVEPFLDQPWGALITPDRIVDHFRDLFELQPEFIGLAQQLFPWYRKHLDELFEKEALRSLAGQLLKLLVLVHLSPARQGLTAQEAAGWLLFSATRVDPARNLKIVEKILARFADQGRFVVREGSAYRLELKEDGGAAFETRLQREMAALRGQRELILALLEPLRGEMEAIFSAWRPAVITFGAVSSDSSTDGCYRQLLDAGINHPLEKLDVVDKLIHAAGSAFDELITRAGSELRLAARRLLPRLDPGKPLLIFADHGFRLERHGGGYRHGGGSTLERVVPLWYCRPHGD